MHSFAPSGEQLNQGAAGHWCARRRGYALIAVLGVLLIVAITGGVVVSRITLYGKLAGDQYLSYKKHHQMLSTRDIVERVVGGNELGNVDIAELARRGEPLAKIELPDDVRLTVYVRGAQGTLMSNAGRAQNDQDATVIRQALKYLDDRNQGDHTRSVGPETVSLHDATDEVLMALVNGNEKAFKVLAEARDEHDEVISRLRHRLLAAEVNRATAESLVRLLTSSPQLWALAVRREDGSGPDIWTLLVIQKEANRTRSLSWEPMGARAVEEWGLGRSGTRGGPDA